MTRTTRRTNTLIIVTLLALALPSLAAAADGGLTLQAIEVRGNGRTSSPSSNASSA